MEERANEIFLNDKGWIESTFHGKQTAETVTAASIQYETLYQQLKQEGKPIYSLVNMDGITEADSGARAAVIPILQKVPFQKIAIYGGNLFIRTLAKFVITVTRDISHMQYFSSREEAEKWLSQ